LLRKIIDMNYTACIPKNSGHHFSGRFYGLLWSWFTRWRLFWLFLRFGCEVMFTVMNWRRNSSELHWNISKHCFEITRSCLWSTVSKCGTHLADRFFIPNCSCKIEITVPCDMPVASTSSRIFTRRSINNRGLYRFLA